jgi:UDP-N-acetylmuramate dehydrogenase
MENCVGPYASLGQCSILIRWDFAMAFLSDCGPIVSEHEPLGRQTYFGVGGSARWMVRPRSQEELSTVVTRCRQEGVNLYVFGLGANLLVSDEGVDGVVIRLCEPAFRNVNWQSGSAGGSTSAKADPATITVGAGMNMARLTLDSVMRGLAGMECMAGIPGTLGGIVRMNAGGRFGQISDVVRDVAVINPDGLAQVLTHAEVEFSYRHTELTGCIVLGATLALKQDDPAAVRKRYDEIWEYKKASQPLADCSAGCVFKNPPGNSAGRLIDQAGLKGYTVGGAYVSQQHANFIAAREGASARDVLTLIGHIRRVVAERFGVELEMEVEVWGQCRAHGDRCMEMESHS